MIKRLHRLMSVTTPATLRRRRYVRRHEASKGALDFWSILFPVPMVGAFLNLLNLLGAALIGRPAKNNKTMCGRERTGTLHGQEIQARWADASDPVRAENMYVRGIGPPAMNREMCLS